MLDRIFRLKVFYPRCSDDMPADMIITLISLLVISPHMSSGRRERIVISCVTFEVAMVVQPAVFYEATKVHLIHYGKNNIYEEFYNEVCRQINDELPKAVIEEHCDDPVFDFNKMMGLILRIIRAEQADGKDKDICVNISAGSSEYNAASLIASMMVSGVIPFTAPSKDFQVPKDQIRNIYFDGDRPVGLTKSCYDPHRLSTYDIAKPDEKLVLGLGVLSDTIAVKGDTSAKNIIKELGKRGLMDYECIKDTDRLEQKSIMSYQRNFIDRWIANEWAVRRSKRTIEITEKGRSVLDVFRRAYEVSGYSSEDTQRTS